MAQISLRDLVKTFGLHTAVSGINLDIRDGEFLIMVGPSGCGKTTTLNMISGLEMPTSGQIVIGNTLVNDLEPGERGLGMVFQDLALFPHMTVFENIAFGLRVRKVPRAEIRARVHELLRLIQLEGLERSLPSQLSGGQRQRVALARALAPAPKVLLLDEPFGALDAKVRQELRQWLRRLHDEIHVTSVFVTHDQEEAFEVSDRVVIMNKGKIEQIGSPAEIFERPANPFVMDFLGNVNVFHGSVAGGRAQLGSLEVDYPDYPYADPRAATAFIRSHELEILRKKNGRPALEVKVTHVNPARPVVKVRVYSETFGVLLTVDVSWDRYTELRLNVGDTVFVSPRHLRVFVQGYAV